MMKIPSSSSFPIITFTIVVAIVVAAAATTTSVSAFHLFGPGGGKNTNTNAVDPYRQVQPHEDLDFSYEAARAAYPRHYTWEEFKRIYKRSYATAEEEERRRGYYFEHLKEADEMARRSPRAVFGANGLADMSPEEFKAISRGGLSVTDEMVQSAKREAAAGAAKQKQKQQTQFSSPTVIDWRKRGAVTAVKNQLRCGGCWAFSTTGNIEGQHFIAGNPLVSLSEQELISCDNRQHGGDDNGCNGGLMPHAFNWLLNQRNGKIDTEASWPFVSGNGQVPFCNFDKGAVGATINGSFNLSHVEADMAQTMASHGPVSIAVDASTWKTYKGGILSAQACESYPEKVDHGGTQCAGRALKELLR